MVAGNLGGDTANGKKFFGSFFKKERAFFLTNRSW